MSFWSGLSSVVSPLASIAGSLWSSSQNRSSAADSMNFQKEVLQNRNQWAVNDLKAAGLNPILAAGATSSGSAAGATAETQNPGQGLSNSAVAFRQVKLAERQQQNQDLIAQSTADLNSAKAAREYSEIQDIGSRLESGMYRSQSEMYGANAAQSREQVKVLNMQSSKIAQDIRESQGRISQLQEQIRNLEQERKESNSRISRNSAESQLARARSALTGAEQNLVNQQRQNAVIEGELKRLAIPEAEQAAGFFEKNKKSSFQLNPRSIAGKNVYGWSKYAR